MLVEEMVSAKINVNVVTLFLSSCRRLCLVTGTESLGRMCSGECVERKGPKNKDSSSLSSSSSSSYGNEIESDIPVSKTTKRQRNGDPPRM